MDDPTAPSTSGPGAAPDPGERRLSRPPSDRYREAVPEAGGPADPDGSDGSPARGIAFAVVVGIVLAAGITVLGGVLLISAGLVVVAAAGGWAIAWALRLGAGGSVLGSKRRWLAVGLTVAAIVVGQVGLWLFARTEGGVLQPIDYLAETFGILVPLQLAAGAVAAGLTAR